MERGLREEDPKLHGMMPDSGVIKERREEMIREVETNRLAKTARGKNRRVSPAAAFARELRLDFDRLVGVFGRSGKAVKRKGHSS